MGITLTQALILRLDSSQKPVNESGKLIVYEENPTHSEYFVTDIHQDSPVGFGVRVTKNSKLYALQKRINGSCSSENLDK